MMANTKEKSIYEQVASEKREEHLQEWEKYHGQVHNEKRGKVGTIDEALTDELQDIISEEHASLKDDHIKKGKESDVDSQHKMIYEAAKKAYLSTLPGAGKGIKDGDELEQKVKEFVEQTHRGVAYNQVIAEALAEDKPYEIKNDRGQITTLGRFLNIYAQNKQESKMEGIEGMSIKRREWLKTQLDSEYNKPWLLEKYSGIISDKEIGRYHGEFAKNAPASSILDAVQTLKEGKELNTKHEHYKMKDHYRDPLPKAA